MQTPSGATAQTAARAAAHRAGALADAERRPALRSARRRASSEALAAVDLDGLRPYRPGTPASPDPLAGGRPRGTGCSSAACRPTATRAAGRARRARRRPDAPPSDLLDAAVRAAASLALELARAGAAGCCCPASSGPPPIDRELSRWPAAHARLALVDGGTDERHAPAPARPAAGARAADLRVAAAPDARLGAVRTAPGRLAVLVVPSRASCRRPPRGVRGPMLATLDVSGCRGFALGVRRRRAATGERAVGVSVERARRGTSRRAAIASRPRRRQVGAEAQPRSCAWRRSRALALYGDRPLGDADAQPRRAWRLCGRCWRSPRSSPLGGAATTPALGTPAALLGSSRLLLAVFPMAGLRWHWVVAPADRRQRRPDRRRPAGAAQRARALPRARPWVRLVIVLGAAVLLLDARGAARSRRGRSATLRRAAAALPLIALAIVPSTLVRPQLPYLQGLVLFAAAGGVHVGRAGRAAPGGRRRSRSRRWRDRGRWSLAPSTRHARPWVNYRALDGHAPDRTSTASTGTRPTGRCAGPARAPRC